MEIYDNDKLIARLRTKDQLRKVGNEYHLSTAVLEEV